MQVKAEVSLVGNSLRVSRRQGLVEGIHVEWVSLKFVKTRGETTQMTRWKQEVGGSDMLEVQPAVSTLDLARAAIPTIEQTISETKNQLAVLCGQTPGTLDRLRRSPPTFPPRPSATVPMCVRRRMATLMSNTELSQILQSEKGASRRWKILFAIGMVFLLAAALDAIDALRHE